MAVVLMAAAWVSKREAKAGRHFAMNDKKPPTKLFTWKHCIFIGVPFIIVIALKLYRDYELKSYLSGRDLIFTVVPLIPLILVVIVIEYLVNRSKKGK